MAKYTGKKKGGEHSTLTEAAKLLTKELQRMPFVDRISPAEIRPGRSGSRHLTLVYTNMGIEMIVSGDGVQKLNVHTTARDKVYRALVENKKLRNWNINVPRERHLG